MRKLLLAIAVLLSIFVLYFALNTNPEFVLFKLNGFKVGFNVTANWLLKIALVVSWGLFFWLSIKEENND